ncbi:hypothetical protein PIB30_011555 [Stylosanthes scabra]|uniref:RNase H type-1 domain-containing protein n=1 Tax=Stylosanthes scabra TaxID=79078 RepID=A0ABU6U8M5_9FABA|nr:hypothetical protein [Stylosanthes scabra]
MWQENTNWLWVWRMRVPEKIKCLMWLCLHDGFLRMFSGLIEIWRDRNNSIFNQDDEWSSLKVKSLALSLTKELKFFNHMQPASVPLSLLVDWTPPLGCTVKINCDASVYNVSHMTGFGCVIRDANRTWIKGCFGTILLCSVLRGELFAIRRGLTLVWEYGCRDVTCEIDNLHAFLAAQLHSKSEHAADVDLIVIHEVLQWNWSVELVLIQRTTNSLLTS